MKELINYINEVKFGINKKKEEDKFFNVTIDKLLDNVDKRIEIFNNLSITLVRNTEDNTVANKDAINAVFIFLNKLFSGKNEDCIKWVHLNIFILQYWDTDNVNIAFIHGTLTTQFVKIEISNGSFVSFSSGNKKFNKDADNEAIQYLKKNIFKK